MNISAKLNFNTIYDNKFNAILNQIYLSVIVEILERLFNNE